MKAFYCAAIFFSVLVANSVVGQEKGARLTGDEVNLLITKAKNKQPEAAYRLYQYYAWSQSNTEEAEKWLAESAEMGSLEGKLEFARRFLNRDEYREKAVFYLVDIFNSEKESSINSLESAFSLGQALESSCRDLAIDFYTYVISHSNNSQLKIQSMIRLVNLYEKYSGKNVELYYWANTLSGYVSPNSALHGRLIKIMQKSSSRSIVNLRKNLLELFPEEKGKRDK
ncbi:hypothetical protein M0G74_12160 [Microbulbifer sp. CAU 1566]|nr:hypothetical protein [Microbulbifer sp. CAU 1566]